MIAAIVLNTLQMINIILGYVSSLTTNKQKILINSSLSCMLSIILFVFTDRLDGVLTTIFIFLRSFLFIYKDKYKTNLVFYFCLLSHILAGIFSYKDIFSLVTLLTPVITCIFYWYGTSLQIKYSSLFINTMWVIYYIYIGLHLTAVNTVINIILTTLSVFQIRKETIKRIE